MICYRKDTSTAIDYDTYCADSLINRVEWDAMSKYINRTLVKVLKTTEQTASLYGSETRTYTEEEAIALCSLPLKGENGYIHLDIDDINNTTSGEFISTIDKHNITLEEFGSRVLSFIVRVFHINANYTLPDPGYRIQTGSWNSEQRNVFVLSIFMDHKCLFTQKDLVRFAGELAESIIQFRLKQCSTQNMYYDAPDYNVHDGGESIYKSTGTIVIKDYPTINDLLFAYKYVDTIFNAIADAFSLIGLECELSDEQIIKAYFGVNYGDDNKWFLEDEDFEEVLHTKSEDIYKLVIEKINKLYFE